MRTSDRLLARTVRRHRGPVAALAVLRLADAGTALAVPAVLAATVDAVLHRDTGGAPIVAICGLVLLVTLVEMGNELVEATVRARAVAWLRAETFTRMLGLGLLGRRRFPVGDAMGRALESTAETSGAAPSGLDLVFSALTSFAGLVALAVIDWRMVLVFALGVPVVWLLARLLIRRTTALTRQYQRVHGELSHRFLDALSGARTIRAAGTLDREVTRVLVPLAGLREAGLGFWEAQRRSGWHLAVLAPVLQIGVLITGGLGVAAGRLSAGELLAAQLYLMQAMGLLSQVGIVAQIGRIRGSAERVQEIFDEPLPDPGRGTVPPGGGALSLHDVTASADGRRVLDGVHLDVPAGARLAVVGASGAGKTTLALVAGGVLAPEQGTVRLDGARLDALDRAEVSAAFAFAFERPHLFGGTVRGMIGYGDRPVPAEAVRAAAVASRADPFVSRLPEGYDTPLGGLRLSGGELQRLGLARAFCRGARVLVLDDALSSVDTATGNDIEHAMDEALHGVTRIVVAHRLRTARNADLVAWLDEGRIRAVGPHVALMAEPAYRAVFGLQEESCPIP
ncbi:ABC transporter ATP-binding protein [Amycolatopsis ultiminotia]|uniref:ABC transporter ATP-binding protein n=1 Tax=Amycolatopsis ultiminotia TaxID=543629 RepID=A0ABP6XBA4_9PSEU